jgi:5-formyltetrahydrofolate cyclo-ligase
MRKRRASLSPPERAAAANSVALRVARELALPRGTRVGLYLSMGSELDTAPLLALARRRGWRVYVPVLHGREAQSMWFQPLAGPLRANRFGIPEPQADAQQRLAPRWLGVVFVPVVAFDDAGHRIGSGAGFYDRSFAYLRRRGAWRKPPLVGLAYDAQRTASIEPREWDVPLDAVVTERAIHRFRHE